MPYISTFIIECKNNEHYHFFAENHAPPGESLPTEYLLRDSKARLKQLAACQEAFAKKPFLSVTFSDILEKEGTQEDRAAQIDIADWLLQWQGNGGVPSVPPVPERNTAQAEGTNPVLAEVAKYFSSDSLPEVTALIENLDLEIISIIPPENAQLYENID